MASSPPPPATSHLRVPPPPTHAPASTLFPSSSFPRHASHASHASRAPTDTLSRRRSADDAFFPNVSSRMETIAFAARKVGKRFGMGKDVILHIDPEGTLRIENPRRKDGHARKEIVVPADALESAVIKGNLRLRLVYLDADGESGANTLEQNRTVADAATTTRVLEFDTPLHREQFVSVLQRRVSGEEDPEDISTAAAKHLQVRFGSSMGRGGSSVSGSESYRNDSINNRLPSSASFQSSTPASSLGTPQRLVSPSSGLRHATPDTRPRQLTAASSERSTSSITTAHSRLSTTPSHLSKRPSLVWTPGGMDTLHPHQASPHSIEKSKGDGHHGGGLLRAAAAPRLSGLLRARLDRVHLFGRLHLRKDLKTSHFGGNWKRRWCMLRGCNILIFKTEQAGVAYAEEVSTLASQSQTTLPAAVADADSTTVFGEAAVEAIRSGTKPYQIIELDACERVERSGSLENMRFTFKLVLPGRLPVIAAAASEAELKSWVDTLEAVLAGETDPATRVRHSLVLRGNVHIRKSGTMYHLGFNWKQRHMVLDGHHIVVTKTDDPEDPVRRELKLLPSSRCGPLDTERPHTFVVINFDPTVGDTQPLVVGASDDEEMMHWANTIQQAIQELAWEDEEEEEEQKGKEEVRSKGEGEEVPAQENDGALDASGTSKGGESKQQRRPGQGHRRRGTGSSISAGSTGTRRGSRGPRPGDDIGVLSRAAARAMERALTEAQKSKAELQAQVSNLASTLQRTKRELGRAQRKQQGQTAATAKAKAGSPQSRSEAAAANPASANSLQSSSSDGDSAAVLALRAQVEALTQQLRNNQLRMHQGEHGEERDDGWDGSLDSAIERLTAAATRLQGGDEAAQGEFDKWDKIVAGHPEQKAKLAAADLAWENAAAPKCVAALELMRTFVPSDIFSMNKEALAGAGVPKSLIRRLLTKKVLHLLRMETADIAKVHIVDLRNRYSSQGLDIVEMRAVYRVLPKKFQLDGNGAKKRWRKDFRNRLMRLTKMEDAGNLRGNAMRHAAYKAASGEQVSVAGAFAGDVGLRKTRAVAGEDYSGAVDIDRGGGRKTKKKTAKRGTAEIPALPFGPGALAAALDKKKKNKKVVTSGGGESGRKGGSPGRSPNPMAAMLEAQFAKQKLKSRR